MTFSMASVCSRISFGLLLIGALGGPLQGMAQFTPAAVNILPNGTDVSNGDAAIADFNNDGLLDLIVTGRLQGGNRTTEVFTNTGLVFLDQNAGLQVMSNSRVDVGDFDQNGTIDLAICGDNGGTRYAKVYSNSGTANFTEITAISNNLPQVTEGDVAWGDYDNDGDLDLAIVGFDGTNYIAEIIENQGANSFIKDDSASFPLIGLRHASIAWGDYDQDGRLDLVMNGQNASNQTVAYVYQNLGNSQFGNVIGASLQGSAHGSVAWGDYDNDGYLDILLSGADAAGNRYTQVYPNQHQANQVQPFAAPINLIGIRDGEAIWADYNYDGWVDVIVAGQNGATNASRITQVYQNDQNGGFTAVTAALPGVNGGAILAAGDVSTVADAKLDLFISGITFGTNVTDSYFYFNSLLPANSQPAAPAGLTATQVGNSVVFQWNPPAGYPADEVAGLSYNLYIGTNPNDDNIDPAHAAIPSGLRRIQTLGSIEQTTWTIQNLPANPNYFVAVQAIDAGFEGSGFSSVVNFSVNSITPISANFDDSTSFAFQNTTIPGGTLEGYVSWCDCDEDGDLDFLYGGNTNVSPSLVNVARLYTNDGDGSFTFQPVQSAAIPEIYRGNVAWGDVNNDGRQDLLIAGTEEGGLIGSPSAKVLINTGNCSFNTTITLPTGVSRAMVDMGDIDGDGDLDLIVAGKGPAGNVTTIYRNQFNETGSVSFQATSNSILGLEYGASRFGDYDNDGDLDLAIAGNSATGPALRVYNNNGTGQFALTSSSAFTGARQSDLTWADTDNDGILELIVMGNTASSGFSPLIKIYKYYPSISLFLSLNVTAFASGNIAVADGSIQAGDYDDDGLIDLLITGRSGDNVSSFPVTKVLRNIGGNDFVEDALSSSNLIDVFNDSEARWGDYNGDQKLDVMLVGSLANNNRVFRVYKNVESSANITPNAPTNLRDSLLNFEVALYWDEPAGPAGNPASANGYNYEVYIDGPAPGNQDISPAMADLTNGYRRIIKQGQIQHRADGIRITGLTPGTYTWGIQAIDQDREGSGFASGGSFVYEDPTFVQENDLRFPNNDEVGLDLAALAWGDYKGDGNLDLVISGQSNTSGFDTRLYEYDANGNLFVEDAFFSNVLIDVRNGDLAWGDLDNDGDLDLLLTGESATGPVSRVYVNINGGFSTTDTLQLLPLQASSAAWIDLNADGHQDVVLFGELANGNARTYVYRNDGNGGLTQVATTLPNLTRGDLATGDLNNDGLQDLYVTGRQNTSTGTGYTRIWYSQGDFTFQVASFPGNTNLREGAVAIADVNADGRADLAFSGENNSGTLIGRIYLNQGAGAWGNSMAFTPGTGGDLAFGDYDDDGYPDLLVLGDNAALPAGKVAGLYRFDPNTQNLIEENIVAAPIPPLGNGAAAGWADFDQDGKLDLLTLGLGNARRFDLLRSLDVTNPNFTPGTPQNLSASIDGDEVILEWDAPANAIGQTIQRGLSYEVYVGTVPNGITQWSPLSEVPGGYRQVARYGATYDTTRLRLRDLPEGTYFWGVQAIDADYEAGPFQAGNSFIYELPVYQEVTATAFAGTPAGIQNGDLDWGDYDQDGDLDLIVAGSTGASTQTTLYRNNNGTLTSVSLGAPGINNASTSWLDVNQDNRLDLLLFGDQGSTPQTRLYINQGSGNLASVNAGLPGLSQAKVAWNDFDRDGDYDLLLSGGTATGRLTEVYWNDGAGNFTAANTGLIALEQGTVAANDLNGDGLPDLFVAGSNGTNWVVTTWRNNGDGTFTQYSPSITALVGPRAAWADYDSDGDLDLALMGGNASTGGSGRLYRNDGNGIFALGPVFAGAINGDLAWTDANEDGNPDLIVTGSDGSNRVVRFYRATGTGIQQSVVAPLPVVPADLARIKIADFDGDGKQDLSMIGQTAAGASLHLYQNVDSAANQPPAAPTNLSATVLADTIFFSWDAPAGPTDGYSYQLMVGTANNGTDVLTPAADVSNGFRYVTGAGKAGQATTVALYGLPDDTYFWRVQAVDQDDEGSAFANGGSIVYEKPLLLFANDELFAAPPASGLNKSDLAWADVDGDGWLDLVAAGENESGQPLLALYRNNQGQLALDPVGGNNLIAVREAAMAWADYDLDGDPDLLVTGQPGTTGANLRLTRLYRNDNGVLVVDQAASDSLPPVRYGAVAWGDVDRDGDPDLAITGESASGPVGAIYLNDEGTFVFDGRRPIQAVQEGDLAWGDYDQDGDLDLVLSGANGNTLHGIIYRNRIGRGDFIQLPNAAANIIATQNSSLAWGDLDNDGDLDLAMTGETTPTQFAPLTRLYRYNQGSQQFEAYPGGTIPGVRNGDLVLADLDQDGFLDLLLGGKSGPLPANRRYACYRSDGSGGLTLDLPTTVHLSGADAGSAIAVADLDNDGHLDLAMTGQAADASPRRIFHLYRNLAPNANTTPAAPRQPQATTGSDTVRLSWLSPLGIPTNQLAGISYNVELRRLNGDKVLSPLAEVPGGFRKIVQRGNAAQRTDLVLRDLAAGTYVWQVQAIDQALEGGPFSVTDTFDFAPPTFVDVTNRLFDVLPAGTVEGDAAWGDFDADGNLDLVITGRSDSQPFSTKLFRNQDGHTLVEDGAGLSLPQLRESAAAWQDVDGDGDLELALTGISTFGRQANIYDLVNSSFVPTNPGITAVTNGDIAFLDADRDGDSDLLLVGESQNGPVLELFLQENGTFTEAGFNWPGLSEASLAVADVNRDGYPDFVAAGLDGGQPQVRLYLASELGPYSSQNISAATAVSNPSLAFMDLDHDGLPDLLMMGEDASGQPVNQWLTNQGNGTFGVAASPATPLLGGTLAVGDFDEDRYGDVIAIGETAGGQAAVNVFLNQAGNGLQPSATLSGELLPLTNAVVRAGDFSGDGVLDLLVMGSDGGNREFRLYQNRSLNFQAPAAPENLDRSIVGASVLLSWDAPAGLTPAEAAALSYNVVLRNDQGEQTLPGHSLETPSGIRQIVAHGNAGQRTQLRVWNLQEGAVYEWQVQAVGQGFEGSPWSATDQFAFTPPAMEDRTGLAFGGNPPEPVINGDLRLGDVDRDGDLDLLIVGETEAGLSRSAIYRNETTSPNNGTFTLDTALTSDLVDLRDAAVLWLDLDGDEDLDLLLAGTQNDGTPLTQLYLLEGGAYVQDFDGSAGFPDLTEAMAAAADYDRDGDLDLVLAGQLEDGTRYLELFQQTLPGLWEVDEAALASISNHQIANGDLVWGDYDSDGDVDLFVAGESDLGPVLRVYRNNGAGSFSLGLYSDFVGVKHADLGLADFDNDGDLDLLVTGDNSTPNTFSAATILYEYQAGPDAFRVFDQEDFPELIEGSADWGDFNNDGWVDVLLSGRFGEADSSVSTRLYRNQNGLSFIEDLNTSGGLANVDLSAATWGDYNGDQKLDMFLTGRSSVSPAALTFALYQNIDTAANEVPQPPLDPFSSILGREVTLTWDAPNNLPTSLRSGLTYQLVLTEVGQPISAQPAQADTSNGYRRIVHRGAIDHNLSWTFVDLPDGDYEWRIQTVDQDFEGSVFTEPQTFTFTNPIPRIVRVDFPAQYPKDGEAIEAYIEINDASIVDEVIVHYKGIASGDWSSRTLTIDQGLYRFPIDASVVDEMGVEYVFELDGTFGYVTMSDTGRTYLYYGEGFDFTNLNNGKRYFDYDIIAVPLVLDNASIGEVIEEYGVYDNREWRLWNYRGGELREYTVNTAFNQFEPGRGFWLISRDPRSFNSGPGRVVEAYDSNPFQIQLEAGWNQLGTPYPFAVSWADILAANSDSTVAQLDDLLAYDRAYVASDRLRHLRGGFVFAETPVTLNIPVRKNPNVQRTGEPVGYFPTGRPSTEEWLLPISLHHAETSYQLGALGMAPDAKVGRDRRDRIAPPRFGEGLELSVPHPEHFGKRFTRDVVPTRKSHIWDFEVVANVEDPLVELRWEADRLPDWGGMHWYLFDVEHQVAINLLETDRYLSLSEATQRPFRLYYGDAAFIEQHLQPERVSLGRPYPNPASEQVSIPFTLPPAADTYAVEIQITNALGQTIEAAELSALRAGFHTWTWEGRNSQGARLPSGMYFYQLIVNGAESVILGGRFRWE